MKVDDNIKLLKVTEPKAMKINELRNIEENKVLDECSAIIVNADDFNDNIDILLKYGNYKNISLLCEDYESALILNE